MTDTDPSLRNGPALYNGRSAPQLATAAEDSLRGIVHLGEAHDRPLDAKTVYRTLSGLTRMVEQLPQVIARLRATVEHQHESGTLRIKAGHFYNDPDAAVRAFSEAVDAILTGYGPLRANLEKAQAALSDAETRNADHD